MIGGERGALWRDGVLDVGQMAGDGVELPLADDDRLGVEDRPFGLVESVEHAAFAENRRLWGVDVFAALLLLGEHAAAETDHAALLVANRENEPSAKPIVVALVASDGEASLLEERDVMFFRLGPVDGVVPLVRREADTEAPDRLVADAALGQVVAGGSGAGVIGQVGFPALGHLLMQGAEFFTE